MNVSRRRLLAGLAAAPLIAAAPDYQLEAVAVAPGVWAVRGADDAIAMRNGGAIANIGIIATAAGAVLIDAGASHRHGLALAALARRLTGKAVALVYLTHLHPDHSFGASAFPPAMVAATPAVVAQVAGDAAGFSAGLYRLLGDWMRGTDVLAPQLPAVAGLVQFGGRTLELLTLAGHSESDLAVLDRDSGTLFAGDLVFHNRAPSTPHADLARWRQSLDQLAGLGHARVVPGHGPVDQTPGTAIAQTRAWLDWLEPALLHALEQGLSMVEAGEMPIPPQLAGMAMARYELQRSVSHYWPALETARVPRL
ncbi:quinoprotein relay system zinc metallohydrolase 1 [Sandarakinorhabdus sp.]|uniref:quinoprotein relay system zinc metallohydrolase 1 n=1 Tax=Sandarakinorhabdus sp. TaxID=1916663 RepID=UPI003F701A35